MEGRLDAKPVDLRDEVVDAALTLIGEGGLDAFSLRDLAQAIGKSTTVIFNLFQTKAGVLRAVAHKAMALDLAFHTDFFSTFAGLAPNRTVLRTVTARYVLSRRQTAPPFARFWIEMLLASRQDDDLNAIFVTWTERRRAFWSDLLSRDPAFSALTGVYFQYLVTEEIYAQALSGRVEYELLLQEGLDALLAAAEGAAPSDAPISQWFLDRLTLPQAPAEALEPNSLKLKLLDIAADQILEGGVSAVTNRSVSLKAATSTSSIPYHYGDMRGFLGRAVWHSVFRELPGYLDPRQPVETTRPADLAGWAERMAPAIALGSETESPGFYVKYGRLIAQICLLAPRDPVFEDLALLLRGPEGGGTFARRQALWPETIALTRLGATHIAMWIKGQALLDAADPKGADPDRRAVLRRGATSLRPRHPT